MTKKKKVNKRVIIWIISLFLLAGIIYILFSSNVLQKLFEKKPQKIDEQEIGIICKQNTRECFYLNKDGIIFKDAPQTSGSLIIIINDFSQRDYKLGGKAADKEVIDSILTIKEYLLLELNLKVSSFDITGFPIEELRVMTKEGWYLMLSLRREIKSQLLALKAALNEKIKTRIGLQYIDLRIENRIYYK